jgi:hypothetical protein
MSNPKYIKTYVTEPYGKGKIDKAIEDQELGGSATRGSKGPVSISNSPTQAMAWVTADLILEDAAG